MVLDFLAFSGLLVAWLGPASALYYLHMLKAPKKGEQGRVSLILPLTGAAARLELLLSALALQSLKPRRLIVAVESEADPAFQRIQACRGQVSFPVQVVVAGLAEVSGQKSRNLLAGLALIDDEDDAIVMLDADIMPSSEWLSHLASPVLKGQHDVVSGYRWQWMAAWSPARLMMAAIDRSIALLPRVPGHAMPWGGSVALGKNALKHIDHQNWLGRSISDDCALGLEIDRLGLRLLVRRVLLLKTPLEGTFASLWLFGRRQYQMIRFYFPGFFWLALLTASLRMLAWIVLIFSWRFPYAWAGVAAMYGAALLGVLLQWEVMRAMDLKDASMGFLPGLMTVLMRPLADLVHLTLIFGSVATDRVVWGHVRYRVRGRTHVRVESRRLWEG